MKFKKKVSSPVVEKELSHLMTLCYELLDLKKKYDKQVMELEQLNEDINELRLRTIPSFAESIGEKGIKSVTLGTGEVVEIKKDMKCNISKANQSKAFKVLDQLGVASIIKNHLTIKLDGTDEKELKKLKSFCLSRDIPFDEKSAVNAATLKSTIKELRQNGNQEVDLSLFGVFDFFETKIQGVKFKKS